MPRGERPLDAADSALGQFAADLRGLREKAGSPPYRALSAKVNYSVAALSKAASGRKLPSLAVALAYVRACDGDPDEWSDRWHALAAESTTELTAETSAEPETNGTVLAPYVGLAAFQPRDSHRFFGREKLAGEVRDSVRERRFTTVVGASGSGKSSVLRAGLLGANAVRDPAIVLTPGARPVEEFAVAFAGFTGAPAATLRTEFAADPVNLHLRVRQALAGRPGTDLILVVDQFEELFTLCADPAERAWLVDALVAAATARTSQTRVVLGVRADFYGHCGHYPALVEALRGGQVLVGPMSTEELRQAITRPAAAAGCMVENALVSRLIADTAGQPAALPMMSHVLLETWRRRSGATLTLAGYEAAGGLQHAIAHTAELIYSGLTARRQAIARRLLLRLTAPGESTEDTKRRVHRHELDTGDPDVRPVLERLARARLLTLDRDTVEITHEALIRCWRRLRNWLAEDRDGLRVHHELTRAAGTWQAHDRDPGTLYRGTRLAQAQAWATANDGALSTREQQFLDASAAAEAAEHTAARDRARRSRRLVALLAVLLVLTTAVTAIAISIQETAAGQRDVATARRVITDANRLRAANPALAAQLGVAAHNLAPLAETRDYLLSASGTPYATMLAGHTSNEVFLAFAPDSRVMATVSWDRTARLWDVTDVRRPAELTTLRLGDPLLAVAFGQNGKTMATVGEDRVRLWDVTDPRRPRELANMPSHTKTASVAFSGDGRLLATATSEKRAQLWDVSSPGDPRELAAFPATSVAFSPVAPLVVAADGHTARLWDVTDPRTPRPLRVLDGHTAAVSAVTFSPDGRTVATGSDDHDLRLWDVSTPGEPRGSAVLTGHSSPIASVAFSPDGRSVASAGGGTILWDVAAGRPLTTIPGGRYSVAFSPDGATLAATGDTRTVRLQELQALPLTGHHGFVVAVAFDPGNQLLATGSWDGSARLWDVSDPHVRRPLAHLPIGAGATRSVMFSPDRRTLATANDDGFVRLWDIGDPRSPQLITTFTPQTREVVALAFSPDGRTLAAGGFRAVTLWDVADRAIPRRLARRDDYTDMVWTVLFSPDGRTLFTGSNSVVLTRLWDVSDPTDPRELDFPLGRNDLVSARSLSPDGRTVAAWSSEHKTVRLLDISDLTRPQPLATLPDHGGTVWMTAFSPDGRRLATAGADRTIRLWDVTQPRDPRHIGTVTGHDGDVAAVTFSPDGHTLASGSTDHTARLWETDTARIATRVCELAFPAITRQEWERYLPEIDYQPPCAR